ncbi:MAG TPA: ABC transporter substrate-binding protein [Bryobacteraceae bacterium]|nr:ABC transporter substrate-binding protein [Bryobacteraceae bacterium]
MRITRFTLIVGLAAALLHGADTSPQRIISTSPNITEILYGIGAFDKVVAVSDYCTYPPAVKSLPRVGGWENSNLEQIIRLRPDLVALSDAQGPMIQPQLQQLGVRTLVVPTRTLANVFEAMNLLGQATGHESQARELAAQVHTKLDTVRLKTSSLPRRRVLLVVDRTPGTLRDLYVATQGSYLAELIDIAGGECIAAPQPAGYSKISKEAVVALAPDLIMDFVHGTTNRLGEDPVAVWGDLSLLRAVRERQVYPVRNEFVPHASQFVADTAELFAHIIHPELDGKSKR